PGFSGCLGAKLTIASCVEIQPSTRVSAGSVSVSYSRTEPSHALLGSTISLKLTPQRLLSLMPGAPSGGHTKLTWGGSASGCSAYGAIAEPWLAIASSSTLSTATLPIGVTVSRSPSRSSSATIVMLSGSDQS